MTWLALWIEINVLGGLCWAIFFAPIRRFEEENHELQTG